MCLELPRRLLADRVSEWLIVGVAIVGEVVLWRHPQWPSGPALAVAGLLLAWQLHRLQRAPTAIEIGPGGWRLRLGDGRWADACPAGGTRLLGRSIVLQWRLGRRMAMTWLTPFDVPEARLRSLAQRLVVLRPRAAG